MTREKSAVCFLLFSALLHGQTDALSVTASKTVDLTPDEMTFSVVVLADQDTTLEQVLQVVKAAGITANNLGGVGSSQFGPSPNQSRLVYQFTLTTPLGKFKDTVDGFTSVRRSLLANSSNMELQTNVVAITPAEASREQARLQATPDLIADARKKADVLAKAAGLTLGPIVGISDVAPALNNQFGPVYGPYGPVGQSGLKTTFIMSVRFGIR
ncbi:MAG TPA: SIMPL domain-containing protein [Bryobacteraceae bacterium]|jgi:hypothetical protein|nr:SIMPL domain-containing protein [Bryobacteraceae bacterium]